MKNTVKLIFGMFAFLAAFNYISCKDPENSGEDATYSESIKKNKKKLIKNTFLHLTLF